MRRFFEILLLVAGLTGIGIWIWSNVRLSVSQKQANRTLEHELSSRGRPVAPPPPALENGALVGRLVIPRLNLKAVVREGAGESTLNVALGHIPGTAFPGQSGNAGIAGHRDTLFRGLRNIRDNDLVEVQTPSGTFNYQVESTDIVKPTDVDVLKASHQPELTLVTCYPFYYIGPAPNRFIVKARLVQSPPATQPESQAETPTKTRLETQAAATPAPVPAVKPPVKPPVPRTVVRVARVARPAQKSERKVVFQVRERNSSVVAPGILIDLSSIDARARRVTGRIWIADGQRTIWLRNQAVNQPLTFRQYSDGKQRQIVLTRVSPGSATGYLLQAQ
jgi:sortase A